MRIPGSSQGTRVLPTSLELPVVQTDPSLPIERSTGNLQPFSQLLRQTEPHYPVASSQRTPFAVEEEIGPFTGNLPASYRDVVEATLASTPDGPVPTGNLWSYAPQSHNVEETTWATQPPNEPKRPHSGKLWAYGNNGEQKKGR